VQRYGPDFRPPFRLVAVCPDGFSDFPFVKAKLDRLLARRPFVQLLHWGCPLLDRYGMGRCQAIHLFPPDPGDGARARALCGQSMLNQGQALAAFTDGSPDIEDLIRRARRQRLPVRVIRVPPGGRAG
jgi:hypothetical protein